MICFFSSEVWCASINWEGLDDLEFLIQTLPQKIYDYQQSKISNLPRAAMCQSQLKENLKYLQEIVNEDVPSVDILRQLVRMCYHAGDMKNIDGLLARLLGSDVGTPQQFFQILNELIELDEIERS